MRGKSFSPYLLISLSPHLFFSFGEGVKHETGNDTQEADEEGEMVGFRWIRVIRKLKALDDLSEEGHEDCDSSHVKEIDPGHHRARDREGKEFLDVRIDPHPKGVEEAYEEEENPVTEGVLNLYNPGQGKETKGIKAQSHKGYHFSGGKGSIGKTA